MYRKHCCGPPRALPAIVIALLVIVAGAPGATVVAGERLQARPVPNVPRASRPTRIDPRVAEFNRDLAAYQRTVAALRRDTHRLQALQRRLDALTKEINSGGEMDMIKLQSLMSSRQTAVQLSTNLLKSLSESEGAVIQNMK